ncbi:aspartate carbamoyltransferase catalytic subunit [Salinibacillus xinjiangensis]|uniref:Aspartate carbamoyltransferase n=1 Tax=Salinibacillus xinjiangensis TaxID=1229268 RepID=A0A6G1X3R2_9BACI|nr:aspartate carbamoyltransferase catalytic subunit [Salinibacillus xinjiangensis]MRG85468.1 aspartate carbamoyltransferase catalytic subunit [Salinibacillus xinjiangensis]
MESLLSMKSLSVDEIYSLLNQAENCRKGEHILHQPKTAALLFFEPSTRTKMSFEMAAHRLGISLLHFSVDSSSVQKGESLYDTVKTVESIGGDLAVIRHPDDAYYKNLKDVNVPIVNAGDGKGEHPTQCLLDLLTIYQEFGTFQNLNVVIAGDILHSRVARSNAYALRKLGANVKFSAPSGWRDHKLPYGYISMDDAVEQSDVLMLLRVQRERHEESQNSMEQDYLTRYGLTMQREKKMKKNSIILHPAPVNRGVEIDSRLVECERSRIFKQMENGVAIRMAIMNKLLAKGGKLNVVAN